MGADQSRDTLPTRWSRPRDDADDAGLVRGDGGGGPAGAGDACTPVMPSLLLGLAVRIVRERREAEDLLHDVFLEAWRAAKDFDPKRGRVRTWLAIRMRSRCLDHQKSARVSRNAGDAGLEVVVDEREKSNPDHGRVRKALGDARRRTAPGRRARLLRGSVVLGDRREDRQTDRHRQIAPRRRPHPPARDGYWEARNDGIHELLPLYALGLLEGDEATTRSRSAIAADPGARARARRARRRADRRRSRRPRISRSA